MQKKPSFKYFLIRNSYLLVIAAWLVTISFIIDNYLTGNSSPKTVAKNINGFITKQENDFDSVSADTVLLRMLANDSYNQKTLQQLTAKKYFLFLFAKNEVGNFNLLFWSTQVIQPSRVNIDDGGQDRLHPIVEWLLCMAEEYIQRPDIYCINTDQVELYDHE